MGKNKGLLKMSKSQLHDFAATKEKKLPMKVHPMKGKGKSKRQMADAMTK